MHYFFILFFLSPLLALFPSVGHAEGGEDKSVLIAILARNKAHVLPRYLECINNLEYDKANITLYINTNNNIDDTKEILEEWIALNGDKYRSIIFEPHEIKKFDSNRPHDWTPERFKVLGKIRNKSLRMAQEQQCDYYFTVDCDNFIAPYTLSVLIEEDKPIIAPLLLPIPEPTDRYSNYFCAVSNSGYYMDHPDYSKIFFREKVGTFKVPVVHCTYLIKTEYIDQLTYTDNSDDYEFIIFSRSARKNKVDQYICNKYEFGELVHFYDFPTLQEEAFRMKLYFEENKKSY